MAKKKHAGSGIVLSREALLNARRVKHDMTQAQLAIAAGLDEKTIRRAESEEPIDPSFAHMIASALGVELSSLVKRDPTSSDPIADAIAKLLVAIVFSGDYPPPYKAAAVKRLTELVLFLGLKGFDAEQISATAGSLIVTVPLSRRDAAILVNAFINGELERFQIASVSVSTQPHTRSDLSPVNPAGAENPIQGAPDLPLSPIGTNPAQWGETPFKYSVGDIVQGVVTRIRHFGAYVELEPGIEGLIHISQASPTYISHTSDVLKTGQEIKAMILEIDTIRKRISLSIKALTIPPEQKHTLPDPKKVPTEPEVSEPEEAEENHPIKGETSSGKLD